jgi:tetratricopeptide (TPR) repeat protein
MEHDSFTPPGKLVNPPQILFPHITKRSVDVGGTVCVIGISEAKELQVYRSLRTEISLAEYEEDIPEVPTGVTEIKVNENQMEDPMSFAQTIVNSLIEITQKRQFLLGILRLECNGFESIIDFDEEHPFEIEIKALMDAFLKARIQDNIPPLLKTAPPPEIPLFVHHERQESVLKFNWKSRQDLFLQLEGLTGTVYGIGTLENAGRQWAMHFYVLEDDITNMNLRGKLVAYPQTLETVIENVKQKAAFPLVWFRFDFGYPFAFAQLPDWENARQLGVFKEAKETYDAYAMQSIAGLEKADEIEVEEDLLPEDEKTRKKRLKALKQGKYNPLGDMDKAIKFFDEILEMDVASQDSKVVKIAEDDPELWYSRSVISRQEGGLDKAKDDSEKAIRFELERIKKNLGAPEGSSATPVSPEIKPPQPFLAKYWHEYGLIFNLSHNLDNAIIAFKNAVSFDPENDIYMQDLANTLLSANYLQEASVLLARILQKKPSNAYGWFKLGELQFRAKQFKSAQESFQKASTLVPNNASFAANLGSTDLFLQDWSGALGAFKKAVTLESNQINYWIGLGIAYAGKTNPVEGNSFAANFPKLMDKASATHHYVLGLARLALGRSKQALQKFNDAKILDENNYQMWVLIADLNEKEGNLNGTATALVNMDRLKPNQTELLERLATVREKLGNWDMAVETYRRLLGIRPWESKYWNALATCLKRAKGNPAEILEAFQKAVDQDKTNVKFLNNLAWQLFTMNQLHKAQAAIDEILRIDKNNTAAHNTLACTLYKQGDQTKDSKVLTQARKEFDYLLRNVPENEWDKTINLVLALECIEKTGKSDKIDTIKKHISPPPKSA